LLAFVPSQVAEALARALDAYLIMEDATVTIGSAALFAVLGPSAYEIAQVARRASPQLIVRRYDGWGVPAVLIAAPSAAASGTEALLRDGVTDAGGTVGTAEEWAQLRTRGFIAEFGVDFDGSMYPQEAGLEARAVSFTKGCYLGQEVVCMLEMRGQVRRKLILISYDGEPLPPNSQVLSTAGDVAGETKSAVAIAPGQSLGFAMVKRALTEAGRTLVVAGADGASRVARVVERTWP
jgi:folate-binding protein YgfZ